MEELLFRGLLFAFFEKHGGLTFAVIATALLFAGLHIPEYWGLWDHVVMILIVGVVFSLVRGMTRSVMPSYILHLAYNGTLMLLLYFHTYYFQKFPRLRVPGTLFDRGSRARTETKRRKQRPLRGRRGVMHRGAA